MRRKPEDVLMLVESHDTLTHAMRQRMDKDYSLYRLNQFQEEGPNGETVTDWRVYTSNEPMTLADKLIAWAATAKVVPRVPAWDKTKANREIDATYERFLIGLLRAADERLMVQLQPKVQAAMAFYVCLRGMVAGRCLLRKRKDGSTFVDITPWDPLHTYWGTDDDGLAWIVYRTLKTRAQIKAQYGVDIEPGTPDPDRGGNPDGFLVYDYYDREHNTVVMEDKVLKAPARHGAPDTPAFLSVAGFAPFVTAYDDNTLTSDLSADFGESVFKAIRGISDNHNLMMSVMLELVARARSVGYTFKSRDGGKTLDSNPYSGESPEVPLAEGEEIKPLELVELTKDAAQFQALVLGDLQRGGVPHSVFGELQFQLSGFAINTLRQGIETQVVPRLEAMEAAYTQIANKLTAQYVTGAFQQLSLRGMDNQRQPFQEEHDPNIIQQAGPCQFTLLPQLPQDDIAKMNLATMAREGPSPILSDRYIRDQYLGIQDPDQMEVEIKEQQGERAVPLAVLWNLMKAAEEQGRTQLAQIYFGEIMELLAQKQMQLAALGLQYQGPIPTPPATNGNGTTADPRAAPNALLGKDPPAPTPQSGPNVPPQSPRPGARDEVSRLNGVGFFGPGG